VKTREHHDKSQYIEKMGESLGSQFYALLQEVIWLHTKWAEFRELFGSNPTRVELLNQAAHAFFGMIQYMLWDDTLLHIARLTDPPTSMGHANLTIKNLPELVNDPATKTVLVALVETAMNKTTFCRDWRNRRIAHSDLDLAMDKSATPLEPVSRKQVNEALSAIADVLNKVDECHTKSTTHFRSGNSAKSLLYVLGDGLRAQAGREERISRGELSEEDYPRNL
jgi:hypothetical protein